ncbi:MAG TPA: ELWxxDGT repeat protein, partial [Coleofasciculaceae cyanobacterium]
MATTNLVPTIVSDIYKGSYSSTYPYTSGTFGLLKGELIFSASDGLHGQELWRSDGSVAGTALVKDIYPGITNRQFNNSSPSDFITLNNTIFFTADNGVTGPELWKSDGTAAGTTLVKDIYAGSNSAFQSQWWWGYQPIGTTNGSLIFFAANDGVTGQELWKSDGTEAGTVLVKDISPASAFPRDFTTVAGTVFFTAEDGVTGRELWKSDGTAAGTVLVKDLYPGFNEQGFLNSSSPSNLTSVNQTLFFVAENDLTGRELWKSDGTTAGTVLVKDIALGSVSSSPSNLTNVNGTLFFTANGGQLWKSDGTAAGTVLVKNILSSGARTNDSNSSKLTNVNGTLFFTANDGVTGQELWKSDGTTAGTVLVKDINPRVIDFRGPWPEGSYPSNLTNVNGTLFFTADDYISGRELWRSDGTTAGTVLVGDITPRSGYGYDGPSSLINVNGTLFFTADDGIHGNEVWKLVSPDQLEPHQSFFSFVQYSRYSGLPDPIALTQQRNAASLLPWLFDEGFYRSHNPDVAAAINRGEIGTGFDHFLSYGQFEGRSPSILFDEGFYRSNNRDVADAIAAGQFTSGLQHFLTYGVKENRDP